jgi:pimeloyl-ACP methyl ester carboxylesterase
VVANSFGSSIALGLAPRRPELFRTLCAHQPPLVSVAADDPAVATFVDDPRAGADRAPRGGAALREFVGVGAWEMMPVTERATMAVNADTFAAAMDRAEVRTLLGAGHVPHATHAADYVAVIRRFAAS